MHGPITSKQYKRIDSCHHYAFNIIVDTSHDLAEANPLNQGMHHHLTKDPHRTIANPCPMPRNLSYFSLSDELEQLHYSYGRLHDAARWVHGNKTYSSFTADELLHQIITAQREWYSCPFPSIGCLTMRTTMVPTYTENVLGPLTTARSRQH